MKLNYYLCLILLRREKRNIEPNADISQSDTSRFVFIMCFLPPPPLIMLPGPEGAKGFTFSAVYSADTAVK